MSRKHLILTYYINIMLAHVGIINHTKIYSDIMEDMMVDDFLYKSKKNLLHILRQTIS